MRPDQLPITTLLGCREGELDDLVVVKLPESVYSLAELEVLLGVMRKYRDLCRAATAQMSGTLQ